MAASPPHLGVVELKVQLVVNTHQLGPAGLKLQVSANTHHLEAVEQAQALNIHLLLAVVAASILKQPLAAVLKRQLVPTHLRRLWLFL